MSNDSEPLAEIAFAAEIVHWRGPAPYLFVPVPAEQVGEVAYAARHASYGWGCVPVAARIGGTDFTSSLFPRAAPISCRSRQPCSGPRGSASATG